MSNWVRCVRCFKLWQFGIGGQCPQCGCKEWSKDNEDE